MPELAGPSLPTPAGRHTAFRDGYSRVKPSQEQRRLDEKAGLSERETRKRFSTSRRKALLWLVNRRYRKESIYRARLGV